MGGALNELIPSIAIGKLELGDFNRFSNTACGCGEKEYEGMACLNKTPAYVQGLSVLVTHREM